MGTKQTNKQTNKKTKIDVLFGAFLSGGCGGGRGLLWCDRHREGGRDVVTIFALCQSLFPACQASELDGLGYLALTLRLGCPVLSCPVLSCPVVYFPCIMSCPVLTCPVLFCSVLPCPALPCPVISWPALSRFLHSRKRQVSGKRGGNACVRELPAACRRRRGARRRYHSP